VLLTVLAVVPCLLVPVDAPVVDPFRPPPCSWCPGNRGLEYATRAGTTVRAPMAGRVSFAGVVAGTRYVVVEQLVDGQRVRVTLGGLLDSGLRTGDTVRLGQVVGTTSTRFHLGLRVADAYVDPTPWLAAAPRLRARLVPLDGQRRLAAPSSALSCPGPADGSRRWESRGGVR
jgi:hypothetical protein